MLLQIAVFLIIAITTTSTFTRAWPHKASILIRPSDREQTNEIELVDSQIDQKAELLANLRPLKSGFPIAIPGSNKHARGIKHYSLGGRVKGDTFIYATQYSYQWETPQNVSIEIHYPEEEETSKALISMVLVHVEESDGSEGQVYVLDGGIGQGTIALELVSRKTLMYRYQVIIYGIEK